MTNSEQVAILDEIIQQLEPSIAEKMRVMFGHLDQTIVPDADPRGLRNWLIVSASLIDRYVLIDGKFNDGQRACMVVEVEKEMEVMRRGTRRVS